MQRHDHLHCSGTFSSQEITSYITSIAGYLTILSVIMASEAQNAANNDSSSRSTAIIVNHWQLIFLFVRGLVTHADTVSASTSARPGRWCYRRAHKNRIGWLRAQGVWSYVRTIDCRTYDACFEWFIGTHCNIADQGTSFWHW